MGQSEANMLITSLLITSTGHPVMAPAVLCGLGHIITQKAVSGKQNLKRGEMLQVQGQQHPTQQIIIQQPQAITVQEQQVAQTVEGRTIFYQPVDADGITLYTDCSDRGQYQQTSSGQGPAIITLPMAGYVINSGGTVINDGILLPGMEMVEEEPLYVNAKQHQHLCKRRQAWAKLKVKGTFQRKRRKYLHETCHSTAEKHCCPGVGTIPNKKKKKKKKKTKAMVQIIQLFSLGQAM
ncbi:unnamed protein product [Nyctereutes procyonoides]|uniref:Nuclear transcription factor Y subunit n=1 Tax=Nyctereutes procyonoides TaxID=34880 RepID=A0A811YWR0_NYCPR|nr:unnamed protein product [Nyctereutes procyonoides]